MLIISLEQCTLDMGLRVGGKALGLGVLMRAGLPVPAGFVLTTEAYRVATRPIDAQIRSVMADPHLSSQRKSENIASLFEQLLLPAEVSQAIDCACRALCEADSPAPVAVRSSATAEDSAEASFAGQQETYLWIRGEAAIKRHIVLCWASLYGTRAIEYRARMNIDVTDLAMAVVVQRMVPAEAAGVMMTLDPVSGDRSQIYIESAFGLGEIVVRGEVDPDKFRVDKAGLDLCAQEIGDKQRAYRFVAEADEVRCIDVPVHQRRQPSMQPDEVVALARIGRTVEEVFGRPMDIEWAIATDGASGNRHFFLLQARPETVWSNKNPDLATAAVAGAEDPLHGWSSDDEYWSTSNVGEAMPGVQTPLSATIWWPAVEGTNRESGYRVGFFSAAERHMPSNMKGGFFRVFYGRFAVGTRYLSLQGDRMPGLTGPLIMEAMLGRVPDDIVFSPTRRFYPRIFWRLFYNYCVIPKQLRRMVEDHGMWWQHSVRNAPQMDRSQAVALLREARDHFFLALLYQDIAVQGLIHPSLGALNLIAQHTGVSEVNQLGSASGNAEMAVVCDLWQASRGRMTVDQIVDRHGFHGPLDGEISTRVWREDATPLRSMVAHYVKLDDASDPTRGDAEREHEHAEIVRKALAAVPPWQRPFIRKALSLARRHIPLRGVAKRCFLQAFDVMRSCARRLGDVLAAEKLIDKPDDVFYLTVDELTKEFPSDAKQRIAMRRQQRIDYQQLSIPSDWKGMPAATSVSAAEDFSNVDCIQGVGVSRGIVEGRVRVVMDPNFADIQPNEILVAPTTDPSWSSIMFISAALVVDIGGALSHAAVVAREMNIPCVVNTRNGTRALRTGDMVRVDGTTGTIHVLNPIREAA